MRVGRKATGLGGKAQKLPRFDIIDFLDSRVAEVIIHHKGGDLAFFGAEIAEKVYQAHKEFPVDFRWRLEDRR